ncbi:calcium-binding protein [Microcoleus vaginatus PCC 9802]|uniref:calcium-binding protein n=2 Tax=Microcoleus vaginatus TaxID=119532 RepID=UPI00020D1469|nr:Hemolysin-type calcium-binding region [Microcoleus vaginatus FGP-2]UNU17613.1 calcium-binding protein [Microcoleus vaginatus PCC 9802]
MALQRDPAGVPRLVGDNTSESVDLFIDNSRFGGVTNFPSGVGMLGGDDTVAGSTANDLIFGNEGEDIITGYFGNDSLLGGKGKDLIGGGDGNDSLNGGLDGDMLLGLGGNDILLGGKGNDFLVSGNGNDTLVGGLGRDFLAGFDDNNSIKLGGSNLYVLQAEPGVTDVNNTDLIVSFRPAFDKIGLADGLTVNDVVLESLTNASITIQAEVPQALGSFLPPDLLGSKSIVTSGTLIKVKNSGDLIGFVESVTPAQLQNSIISTQGF